MANRQLQAKHELGLRQRMDNGKAYGAHQYLMGRAERKACIEAAKQFDPAHHVVVRGSYSGSHNPPVPVGKRGRRPTKSTYGNGTRIEMGLKPECYDTRVLLIKRS